jgi:polyisoprenoid-binding protein YceI
MTKSPLLALAAATALTAFAPVARHVAAPPTRFVIAPTGNEARYRVREQLLHHDLPNDAVGKTTDITGAIVVSSSGAIDTTASKITIGVASLTSDQPRRDGYVRNRLLETDQYPSVVFVPTTITGAPTPLPTSGPTSFDVAGRITVHGVTRPTVWHVTAQATGADITGTGATTLTFAELSLDQPHVPVVLSVADTIKLEYDFHLTRESR